jgi:hypothetical protein
MEKPIIYKHGETMYRIFPRGIDGRGCGFAQKLQGGIWVVVSSNVFDVLIKKAVD